MNSIHRKTRDVLNHHQDSTNWDFVEFREGDIVAANWAKAGITWLQQILLQLIHGGDPAVKVRDSGIWLDWWTIPKSDIPKWTSAIPGRRVFKTHLPADALNLLPQVKYIYIGRDVRDIIWSFYPHLMNYTDDLIALANSAPHRKAERDFVVPTTDIRAYYHSFLENDGAPYWPFWESVQSWWDVRELPNVMLVHYQNLKDDLPGMIQKIAAFIEAPIANEAWPKILEHCSFTYMKAHKDELLPIDSFKDKGATFMHKGETGRWRATLSPEEIDKADRIASEHLSPDCAHWLKTGEGASG
ncbi:MAG TPA: sulfotransferase domain-containing protein [Alphaproteobacteria bacterium]|nr:sulfotransferase domain-containing protein [Alphaproteobacteria bacterium]